MALSGHVTARRQGPPDKGLPHVTVVGIGPAGPEYLTEQAVRVLDDARVLLCRTARHPASAPLISRGARALDEHYEEASSFEVAYENIVEDVIKEAVTHGEVVYAVPGSPMVLESTVEALCSDPRVRVEIVPGMSFLDLAWGRLGIDPIKDHVRLVDAESFPTDAADDHGPLLIAQVYAKSVASAIKLAVDVEPQRPIVVLSRLGCDDEAVVTIPWAELDRSVEYDHLSCVFVPELTSRVGEDLMRAIEVVKTLRSSCPWDKVQTHETLVRHLIEETYEAVEAIQELTEGRDTSGGAHLEEELGDVLCQVLFHATIAAEEGLFDVAAVARTLHEKLVRRHPHVFGGSEHLGSADAVLSRWEQIKQEEKGRTSLMDGIPVGLPALLLVAKLERKASGVGLGARTTGKDDEELSGLFSSFLSGEKDGLGELVLGISRLAVASGLDPEEALRKAAFSLRERFMAAEAAALADKRPFPQLSTEERLRYWDAAGAKAPPQGTPL